MDQSLSALSVTLNEIKAAARCIEDVSLRSPLVPYPAGVNTEIRLKAENLQPTGSFKIRGSTNAVRVIAPAELARGVYTASAGNFGQGLAMAARRAGVPARVYVPRNAARVKIRALEALGATVTVKSPEDWWSIMVNRRADGEEGHFIHPCADRDVIVGNATIGVEIAEDWPEVNTILVPFGGGGLAIGIAIGAKAIRPGVRVIACESEAATPLAAAFGAGRPVKVPFDTTTFINGMGSTSVLDDNWPLLRHWVDDVVVVSVDAARDAVRRIAMDCHMVAEGAGAVALAAALRTSDSGHDFGRVAGIVSGGNIDSDTLAMILGAGQAQTTM